MTRYEGIRFEALRTSLVAAIAAACLTGAIVARADQPVVPTTVELVSGESSSRDALAAIDANQIQFAGGEPLPVDDALAIRFGQSSTPAAMRTGPVVHLAGGGLLPVTDAVLVDDSCRATLPDGRTVTLSLNDVAAIQWSSTVDSAWHSSLARPSEEHDLVVVKASPAATAIRAFVEAVGAESVEFDWDKQTRTLPRQQVIGIVFARPTEMNGQARLFVHTRDRALIPSKSIRRLDDRAAYQCTLSSGSELEIPADHLESITIRSTRVKYLSDMQPVDVRERPIVAFPRPWQANRNVLGEPLKAGDRTFERGIGVQSGSSLTFEAVGAEQFAAVLSVNSPPGVAGDCEFVVAVDDREVARRRVRNGDAPVALRVPLSAAKRLELRVEYGLNLDFGDHANWCDAYLVLNSPVLEKPVTTSASPRGGMVK